MVVEKGSYQPVLAGATPIVPNSMKIPSPLQVALTHRSKIDGRGDMIGSEHTRAHGKELLLCLNQLCSDFHPKLFYYHELNDHFLKQKQNMQPQAFTFLVRDQCLGANGSYSAFPLGLSPWSRGSKLVKFLTIRAAGQNNRFTSLKCKSCLSVGATFVLGPKTKLFKISAFKGSGCGDAGSRVSGSKTLKNPVKVSYIHSESEESSVKSSVQNIPVSCTSTADETATQSLAIQNLFKNWLMLLLATSQNQKVNVLEEPSSVETLEMQNSLQKQERVKIVKAAWCSFLGLDATIKIPFFIFVPSYLAVNLAYGSVVARELTPLWVLGPVIVAFYIKIVRFICGLYLFSFKQTVKIVRNLPIYYLVLHNYIMRKFKEDIRVLIWQPVVDIRNMDYKEVTRQKAKDLEIWLAEKYQDYVESIWPYYCRMIRFLKRANLI